MHFSEVSLLLLFLFPVFPLHPSDAEISFGLAQGRSTLVIQQDSPEEKKEELIPLSRDSAIEQEITLLYPHPKKGYKISSKDLIEGERSTTFNEIFVEGKIAYFYPNSGKIRRIYSEAPIYNIEVDGRVFDDFYAWGSLGYFTAPGKTIDDEEACHLTMVPIATGLKYIYRAFSIQPYAGAGLLVGYVQGTANASDLVHSLSTWQTGGIFKVGALAVKGPLFFDAFIDYSLLTGRMSHSSDKRVLLPTFNVSGFSFGGGFGYRF